MKERFKLAHEGEIQVGARRRDSSWRMKETFKLLAHEGEIQVGNE